MNKALKTLLKTDVYKVGHRTLYPEGTEIVFSNFTPRSGNYSGNDADFVIASGMRFAVNKLRDEFIENLTGVDANKVAFAYRLKVEEVLGIKNFDSKHIVELIEYVETHQDLPLEFRAVAEGTKVAYKTPILTVHNKDKRFA